METTLYIKNMVCNRCITAVENALKSIGANVVSVDLGTAVISGQTDESKLKEIRKVLVELGFELINNKKHRTIERIKNAVIELVHYKDNNTAVNLSTYISSLMHSDYNSLSRLFSEFTGMTIERFFILQRIERVKELIFYDEMSLTQIAFKLNYSSVAYLSNQFKQVTGMTPSQFKTLKNKKLRALDSI